MLLLVASSAILTVVHGQHLGRRRRSLTLFQLDDEELLKKKEDVKPYEAEIEEMEAQVSSLST